MSRRLMLRNASGGGGVILPTEYQQVEWLAIGPNTSSSNAAFDTGQIATYQTELGIRLAAITGTTRNYLSARPDNTGAANSFILAHFASDNMIGFGFFGAWYRAIPFDEEFHDFVISNEFLKCDGITYGSPRVSSGTTSRTIQFFTENGANRFVGHAQKIAYAYIKQGTNLTGEYYPCYKKSDGTVGFYNIVDDTFIMKDGTLPVVKGADVN